MKKITLSLATIIATSTFALAGGDIAPVEPVVETPVVMETPSVGGLYLGVGFGLFKSDSSFLEVNHEGNNFPSLDFSDDTSAMMFQGGYKVNSYLSLEARYWVSLTDNEFTITGNTFNSDAAAWGFYVKPTYPVTDSFDIYGLLGYGKSIVNDVRIGNLNRNFEVDGFSWGVGAAYSFTDSIAIFVDYVDFQDDDITFKGLKTTGKFNHSFDSINFGLTYQF